MSDLLTKAKKSGNCPEKSGGNLRTSHFRLREKGSPEEPDFPFAVVRQSPVDFPFPLSGMGGPPEKRRGMAHHISFLGRVQ